MNQPKNNCPLCQSVRLEFWFKDSKREYYQCGECDLVFVPRSQLVSQELELHRYNQHENQPQNTGYLNYHEKNFRICLPYLKAGSCGLDFGSGQGQVLTDIFRHAGFRMDAFDIYYHPSNDWEKKLYDFVLMIEVIEHLREPWGDINKIAMSINKNGKCFIRTLVRPETTAEFSHWHYCRDITHIQFFSDQTFQKMREIFGLKNLERLNQEFWMLEK